MPLTINVFIVKAGETCYLLSWFMHFRMNFVKVLVKGLLYMFDIYHIWLCIASVSKRHVMSMYSPVSFHKLYLNKAVQTKIYIMLPTLILPPSSNR
jgi:hypothetical protein